MKLFKGKALEIRYVLMDHYLVDVPWISEAVGRNKICIFDFKPTDDAYYLPTFECGLIQCL